MNKHVWVILGLPRNALASWEYLGVYSTAKKAKKVVHKALKMKVHWTKTRGGVWQIRDVPGWAWLHVEPETINFSPVNEFKIQMQMDMAMEAEEAALRKPWEGFIDS